MTLPAYALPLIVVVVGAACFFAGLLIERMAWNDLIKRGVLPKPR